MKKINLTVFISILIIGSKLFGQVIYEIYPGGGASGATYQYEAIILQGTPNQSLSGKSIQYATATGSFSMNTLVFSASHAFNSEGFFYIQAGNFGSGAPLPFSPDAIFGFALGNNGGKLALVSNSTNLSGSCPLPNAAIHDFVGYGSTATCSETAPFSLWAGSVTSSMKRFQDTNNNSVDFVINNAPLPIELTDFKATPQKNDILLQWTTVSEKNNNYFSVERSENGLDFMEIGQVNSIGNSSDRNNYTFTDENPLPDNNYYRLKQVDTDGNFEYSSIRMIRLGKTNTLALYPNPTSTGTSNLSYLSTAEEVLVIDIIDGLGREITSQSVNVNKGENQIPVSTMDLTSGVYWLKVKSGAATQAIPVIVK